MNQLLNKLSPYSHILPRIVLATTFLVHGFPKLINPIPMTEMGMPLFMVYLIGLFEVGGALLFVIRNYQGLGYADWCSLDFSNHGWCDCNGSYQGWMARERMAVINFSS